MSDVLNDDVDSIGEPERPRPSVEEEVVVPPPPEVETLTLRESVTVSTVAVVFLAAVAAVAVIYLAKPILLPVIFAVLANFVFRPVHRRLIRMHIPRVPGAAFILVAVAGTIIALAMYLAAPVSQWMQQVPQDMLRIEAKLRQLREPVQRVSEAAQSVDEITAVQSEEQEQPVVTPQSRTSDRVWAHLQSFGGYAVVVLILLFFILAYGETIYRKLSQTEEMAGFVDEIASSVSAYLFTITCINAGLGVCIGVAMYLLGMPNPLVWGLAGMFLNYVPYFGAIVGVIVTGFVAFLSFEEMYRVLAVPAVYFLLTSAEGSFITPMILGRRFTINPIVIFVWLMFWGWLWGIPGALIAVPLLMAFKIMCDHIRTLAWVSYLISLEPVEQITGNPEGEGN